MQHFTKSFGEVCWSWHLNGVYKCYIKKDKLKMVKPSEVPLRLKIYKVLLQYYWHMNYQTATFHIKHSLIIPSH